MNNCELSMSGKLGGIWVTGHEISIQANCATKQIIIEWHRLIYFTPA